MKKRIKKKWIVYCLKSKEKQDWIFLYKVWCCKKYNLMSRNYYWNSKLKIKFEIFKVYHSQDIYKDENDIQWKLHWESYWMALFWLSFELFWDFDNKLNSKMISLFHKYMFNEN